MHHSDFIFTGVKCLNACQNISINKPQNVIRYTTMFATYVLFNVLLTCCEYMYISQTSRKQPIQNYSKDVSQHNPTLITAFLSLT